jgi:hypothetical protein
MSLHSPHRHSSSISNNEPHSFLEPDFILPEQFYSVDEIGLQNGERKLMTAILSDGIEAFIAQCSLQSAASTVEEEEIEESVRLERFFCRNDAGSWVYTSDGEYIFSFDNVCQCLGINPEYLRLGLIRYASAVFEQQKQGTAKKLWKKIRRPRKKS